MALTYQVAAPSLLMDQLLAPFVDHVVCQDKDVVGELATLRGPMKEGVFFRVFIPLISTRAVEIGFESGVFMTKVLLGASDEDHELAQQLVSRAAMVARGTVTCEGGLSYSYRELDAFRAAFGRQRIRDQSRIEIQSLAAAVGAAGAKLRILKLDGPVRPFHFGRRMLGEMTARDAEDRDLWLIARIHAAQWPEVEHTAAEVLAPPKGGFTAAQWPSGKRVLLPDCDYYVLADGQLTDAALAQAVIIPSHRLPEVAGGAFTWLDERNAMVEPIERDAWNYLLTRARRFHEMPFKR